MPDPGYRVQEVYAEARGYFIPVSIPDPATASTRIDGVRFVTLEKLTE